MEGKPDVISGNIVDVLHSEIYPGTIRIAEGRIASISRGEVEDDVYILPGFVDSHIHVESSMLTPSEFARIAVTHGTVAVVSDPHEIANVLGVEGVKYMIEDSETVPFKFYFGAPSCVPASPYETTGTLLGPEEVEELLRMEEIRFLGEVMDFPGVLNDDPAVKRKISIARKYSKVIDGHAPGLRGGDLQKYVDAGVSTDHECTTEAEALEKIGRGMKVQIREGSAAKNFDELIPILEKHYGRCMFCSDDKHPDDLVRGHINDLVERAVNHGVDLMKALRAACVNPVLHYGLEVGLLQEGDYADLLVVDNLKDFNVVKTLINGRVVAEEGCSLIPGTRSKIINNFKARGVEAGDLAIPYGGGSINVIEAVDGQLVTNRSTLQPKVLNGLVVSDVERDVLKIVVVNRYEEAKATVGFIKNFGLKGGAIASSIAHDSHNIIAVGCDDEDIRRAVNLITVNRGGISAVHEGEEAVLPLPIAGLMSNKDYRRVAEKYVELNDRAKSSGSKLEEPFMTLSFMALTVIPKIKITDKGLFDVEKNRFINLFSE